MVGLYDYLRNDRDHIQENIYIHYQHNNDRDLNNSHNGLDDIFCNLGKHRTFSTKNKGEIR